MKKKIEINAVLFYLLIGLIFLRAGADIGQFIA